MRIEYGGGSAAVIYDARTRAHIVVSPAHPLPPEYGGTHYYASRSGLSGAWRCPSRPYLRAARTYRTVRGEYPVPGLGTPWLPVDRDSIRADAPLVRDVIVDSDREVVVVLADAHREQEVHRYALTCATDPVAPLAEHELHIVTARGSPPRYEDRRVAWGIARQYWRSLMAPCAHVVPCGYLPHQHLDAPELEPGSAEWLAASLSGCQRVGGTGDAALQISRLGATRPCEHEYAVHDRDGLVVGQVPDAAALLTWLRTEPDHAGMGVLAAAPADGQCIIVDRGGEAWCFDIATGLFHFVLGAVDWSAGTVTALTSSVSRPRVAEGAP